MRNLLWTESVKIIDFAIRKGLEFKQYNLDLFKIGIHLILKLINVCRAK